MKKLVKSRSKSKVRESSKGVKQLAGSSLSDATRKAASSKSNAKPVVKAQPLIGTDGEVREVTAYDMALFKPTSAALPEILELQKQSRGRPQKALKSVAKSIRLAPDVAQHFEAMGRGWQTRMNEVLRELISADKI